jgi:hypothetical protein
MQTDNPELFNCLSENCGERLVHLPKGSPALTLCLAF